MNPVLSNFASLGFLTVSGTNKARAIIPVPALILRVGFMVTTALTVTAAVITWNITKATGAAASPTGAAALGTTTATSATMAINKGLYLDVGAVKGNRIVLPGEAVEADVTIASTVGVVVPFIVFDPRGWADVDLRANVASHPGSTDNATALAALTKVIV